MLSAPRAGIKEGRGEGSQPSPPAVELLAPAGDFSKLQSAIHFGADAVYLSGQSFGLRTASKNFGRQEVAQAVRYAHDRGVKVHITMNIVPHDEDLRGVEDYLKWLEEVGVDALIISDPGLFSIARQLTGLPIHISTQASVTNAATIRFWQEQGASRVILARELSLEEIRRIRKEIDPAMELECFVHGAMCISYSGRCLLSSYMTGRDANRGDCAQPCRWKYRLVEEGRPGQYFPIEEGEEGTFIMNSRDLCLLKELPQLMEAGVNSFKLEGRVKSQYYVSTVVHAYRQAIDSIQAGSFSQEEGERLVRELEKTSHRPFTKGFFYGQPGREGQNYSSSSYVQDYDFVGLVKDYDPERGMALVEERNKFKRGDQLEIFGREPAFHSFILEEVKEEGGEAVEEANVPQKNFWISLPCPAEPGDILRKARREGGVDSPSDHH